MQFGMQRRTLLLGTAGLAAARLTRKGFAQAQGWSPQVLQYVRDLQEREYNQLADALGLSSAKSAYEKVAGRRLPADVEQQYGSEALPTPYEDRSMYTIMKVTFEGLSRENDALDAPALPHPFLATLPAGEVEARIVEEPETKTPIVFFEQGLFYFFYDMAKLMAWAAPPLTEEQLTNDDALAGIPRRYTMPFRASENFAAALHSYAVRGTPLGAASPIPEPSHNLGLSVRLLNHMVRFVMAHELAHIRERHADNPQTPQLEFVADALGASLVTTLADLNHGSWAVGYWGCELALVALNALYRAIGLFTFGPERLTWVSRTHPDPLDRRENLRGIWLNKQSPKTGVAAAREMSGMMESTFQRLWEIGLVELLLGYHRGDRASARWRKTAANWRVATAAKG
jgi:hypothetical protein